MHAADLLFLGRRREAASDIDNTAKSLHDPDLASLPVGHRLVGKIKLPISWRRYDRCAARIQKEHPGVRSFPEGNATLFAVPAACSPDWHFHESVRKCS